ncbi:hypothetical protein [Aurantiacibacter poecillastricola]|uniref:hypothetical protein n=1 Tax=Aurantiacibacter poecillastricola TaxID=3064385 RepID=UPI00273F534B|nr:hypothetical protein [Aurantiacibacter sp. 219JJ12-13]MDP5260329.1 hypothetical protein [Aurantiacibacter sp. 219JJ12-13]
MATPLLQFAGSLLAVAVLVALTWLLGSQTEPRLESEQEARELLRHSPGGFEPVEIALANNGCAAIANDNAGRQAVVVPHGSRFVTRMLPANTPITMRGEVLDIEVNPPLVLALDDKAKYWTGADNLVN